MRTKSMLRVFTAVALVWALGQPSACRATEPLNVLFIGNSLTYFYDLPGTFRDVATSAGQLTPHINSSTPGSTDLYYHLHDPDCLTKIDSGYGLSHLPWDYVVLQQNSGGAAWSEYDEYSRDDFQSSAVGLYDRIKVNNPNAQVVFYETPAYNERMWDPEAGTNMGPNARLMQAQTRRWYLETAYLYIPANSVSERKSDTMVARCGDAWERVYSDPNGIMLHEPDCLHPCLAGTYLNALMMYATMYNATPSPIVYTAGLSRANADYLQGIASMPFYHDDEPPAPVTSFTATSGDTFVEFTWTNPTTPDFLAANVVYRTDRFPENINDGVLVATVSNEPGSSSWSYHTDLANGTTHYYAAFSWDLAHFGTPAQATAVPADVTPPEPVTDFSAIPASGRVALFWTNPIDYDFAGLKILSKTTGYPTSITDGDTVYEGAGTSCVHTGLTDGITYYYAAFAYDEVPNVSVPALVTGSPQTLPEWVNEPFDNYDGADLGAQGGWATIGAFGAVVQSGYAKGGTGKAALLDTLERGGSVRNQITFDDRTSGYFLVDFDVAQDAAGAVGQELGYVSIYGASSATEIAKVRIQKGRMFLEYGSETLAIVSPSVTNLAWLNVRVGIDAGLRKLDLWLDGTSKATGLAWKGASMDVCRVVIGSDPNSALDPRRIYIDNLRVEPKPGQVTAVTDDGLWTPNPSKLHFRFPAVPGTPEYQYAIGTSSLGGGTQIRDWTSCGTSTDVTAENLTLADNTSYYITVQCLTQFGTAGPNKVSNGIKVAPGVVRINEAKALPNGTTTTLKSLRGKLVSAQFPGCFYIQEPTRPFGIKVVSAAAVSAGDQVDVCGIMKGSGAERYLDATGNVVFRTTPGPGGPRAVALANSWIGGVTLNAYAPGVVGGMGPNNIGSLITAFGAVTQRQTTSPMYFYIDDGCGLTDGTTTGGAANVGVRVSADPASYAEGAYVAVKGIVSCFDSTGLRPQILPVSVQTLRAP